MAAGMSQFRVVGWFMCADGGHHALADSRSRIKNCRLSLPFLRKA
jgi:hypothetical protein